MPTREEQKKIKANFDWLFYTTFYPDLNHIGDKEGAWKHFKYHGYSEGRIYNKQVHQKNADNAILKSNFDWEFYTKYYDDLKHFTDKYSAWEHYAKHGKSERRIKNKNELINSKSDVKILIVLPTYNRSNYLPTILKNIKNQLFKNYVLLIIDDGSSQEHKEEFNKLKEKYKNVNKLVFMENEENCHIAKTLNKGIEYLLNNEEFTHFTWISDDNIYYPNYLSDLVENNTFFKYTAYDIQELDGAINTNLKEYTGYDDILNNFVGCEAFMWTREAIDAVGFYDENLKGCEDYEYLLRTFKYDQISKCVFSDRITMKYIVSLKNNNNDELCVQNGAKKILIVLDKYNKGGLEKHTDNIQEDFNCDIAVISGSIKNHNNIKNVNFTEYATVIWQNTFINLPPKLHGQKYIYIVHDLAHLWDGNNKKNIIINNILIDIYIYVSKNVKNSFETNVLNPKKSFIIENKIKPIINDKQENDYLFISSGSYDKNSCHHNLIEEFSKLDKIYKLEIYGHIIDSDYHNSLKQLISAKGCDNIELFEYSDSYIDRLKEASYFISFDGSKGCSYAMLEAISLNKKIICKKKSLTEEMSWYPNKCVYKDNSSILKWFEINKLDYLPYSYFHFTNAYGNILFSNLYKTKIGKVIVNDINDVLCEISETKETTTNGYSVLLRIKNEEDTIGKCILDIVDLVDEIIVVDNGSTDKTLSIIKKLEELYSNVYVYEYKISVPRFGKEHVDNFKRTDINKENTLCNFYNWTASKSTFNKKIKWDGDFYCIRNNFKSLLNNFINETNKLSVHFSGLTIFIHNDKYYIKNDSYYNEYRLFCNKTEKIWTDRFIDEGNYCEWADDFSKMVDNKFICTSPCFFEIKMTSKNEFDSRSSNINDGRDNVDLKIINNFKNNICNNNVAKTDNLYHSYNSYYFNTVEYDNNLNNIKNIQYIPINLYMNIFKTSNSHLRKHVFSKKKKIIMVIDTYGWAFNNIAKNVKKLYCKNDREFYIETYPELYDKIKNTTPCSNYLCRSNNKHKYSNFNINETPNVVIIFWYGGSTVDILDFFRKKQSKVFLTFYDYSKWINNTDKSEEREVRKSLDYFMNNIDGYFYSCPTIKKLIERTYPDKKISSYKCYDGVDSKLFYNQGYGQDIYVKDKLVVGWIGNSNPSAHGINKGFTIIQETLSELSDKFIFLPQDSYTGKYLNHDDIPEYIKKIDIILCFSMFEGTPNQILECSSSGKCWISTNVGIVTELNNTIKNNKCGIVINRDKDKLKETLLYLYENRNLIVEYGKNGRKAIEHAWDWTEKSQQFYI